MPLPQDYRHLLNAPSEWRLVTLDNFMYNTWASLGTNWTPPGSTWNLQYTAILGPHFGIT